MHKINFHNVDITVYNLSLIDDYWESDYISQTQGVIYSQLLLNGETQNVINNGKDINATLILRNQSDYSNVVILIGIFNLKSDFNSEKEKVIFVEFLFDEISKYVNNNELKGKDNKKFIIPINHYSYSLF